MRTREEQIAHLSCAIFNERPGYIDDCMDLAREYILEAERRAEQRVRAEIGRDSERLDNMREKFRIAKNGLLRVKEITGESSRAHQAADRALTQIADRTTDAARETE